MGSIDAYGKRNDFHQFDDQGYDPGFPESFRVDKTVEFHHSPNSYTTYNIRNYSAARRTARGGTRLLRPARSGARPHPALRSAPPTSQRLLPDLTGGLSLGLVHRGPRQGVNMRKVARPPPRVWLGGQSLIGDMSSDRST